MSFAKALGSVRALNTAKCRPEGINRLQANAEANVEQANHSSLFRYHTRHRDCATLTRFTAKLDYTRNGMPSVRNALMQMILSHLEVALMLAEMFGIVG